MLRYPHRPLKPRPHILRWSPPAPADHGSYDCFTAVKLERNRSECDALATYQGKDVTSVDLAPIIRAIDQGAGFSSKYLRMLRSSSVLPISPTSLSTRFPRLKIRNVGVAVIWYLTGTW